MSKFLNIFAPAATGMVAVLGSAYFLADQFVVDMPAPARDRIVTPAKAESHGAESAEAMARADEDAATKEAAVPAGAKHGLGRPATDEEIAAWDVKVFPDGRGLPVGSGSVEDGEMIFSDNCAVCHGEFAEGSGNWPKLAGGDDTLADEDPLKTVGSYWPYLSTAFDYVHRSMPFGAAQTMSADDTYAIVAYILYSNFLVEDDFVLSNENFLDVEMPNANGFIVDDRPETEYTKWRTEPCMENCKENVEITMRATVLDVTPDEPAAGEPEADEPTEEATTEAPADEAAVEAIAEAEEMVSEAEIAAADPELIAKGEKVFKKCQACHQVGPDASNKTGPLLNGIVGRKAATVEGFKYSKAMKDAGEEGLVWTPETMHEFLTKPRTFIKKTRMSFNGLKKPEDIDAVTAYLSTFPE